MGRGDGGSKLNFCARSFSDRDLEDISRTDYEEVDFSRNGLSAADLRKVLELCGRLHQLRVLKLFRNDIDDAGAEALAAFLRKCKSIEEMHLSHNRFTARGVEALVRAGEEARPADAIPLWLRVEQNDVEGARQVFNGLKNRFSVCMKDRDSCNVRHCSRGCKVHLPHFLIQQNSRDEDPGGGHSERKWRRGGKGGDWEDDHWDGGRDDHWGSRGGKGGRWEGKGGGRGPWEEDDDEDHWGDWAGGARRREREPPREPSEDPAPPEKRVKVVGGIFGRAVSAVKKDGPALAALPDRPAEEALADGRPDGRGERSRLLPNSAAGRMLGPLGVLGTRRRKRVLLRERQAVDGEAEEPDDGRQGSQRRPRAELRPSGRPADAVEAKRELPSPPARPARPGRNRDAERPPRERRAEGDRERDRDRERRTAREPVRKRSRSASRNRKKVATKTARRSRSRSRRREGREARDGRERRRRGEEPTGRRRKNASPDRSPSERVAAAKRAQKLVESIKPREAKKEKVEKSARGSDRQAVAEAPKGIVVAARPKRAAAKSAPPAAAVSRSAAPVVAVAKKASAPPPAAAAPRRLQGAVPKAGAKSAARPAAAAAAAAPVVKSAPGGNEADYDSYTYTEAEESEEEPVVAGAAAARPAAPAARAVAAKAAAAPKVAVKAASRAAPPAAAAVVSVGDDDDVSYEYEEEEEEEQPFPDKPL